MTAQSVREDIEQSVGFSLTKRSRKRELVEARSVYYKYAETSYLWAIKR